MTLVSFQYCTVPRRFHFFTSSLWLEVFCDSISICLLNSPTQHFEEAQCNGYEESPGLVWFD